MDFATTTFVKTVSGSQGGAVEVLSPRKQYLGIGCDCSLVKQIVISQRVHAVAMADTS